MSCCGHREGRIPDGDMLLGLQKGPKSGRGFPQPGLRDRVWTGKPMDNHIVLRELTASYPGWNVACGETKRVILDLQESAWRAGLQVT